MSADHAATLDLLRDALKALLPNPGDRCCGCGRYTNYPGGETHYGHCAAYRIAMFLGENPDKERGA